MALIRAWGVQSHDCIHQQWEELNHEPQRNSWSSLTCPVSVIHVGVGNMCRFSCRLTSGSGFACPYELWPTICHMVVVLAEIVMLFSWVNL